MAWAAVSRSSNIRLRGAGVWLTTRPVDASILSIAPQSGQATSNIFSFLTISTRIVCAHGADCIGATKAPSALLDQNVNLELLFVRQRRIPGADVVQQQNSVARLLCLKL